MDPGKVLGWARIALFVGMIGVVGGLGMQRSILAWIGVGVVGIAFTANVVAKVTHVRDLALTPEQRTRLAATWLFLAVAVVALFVVAVANRTLGASLGLFWPLVVVVAGLGATYRYFQRRYLEDETATERSDSEDVANDEAT